MMHMEEVKIEKKKKEKKEKEKVKERGIEFLNRFTTWEASWHLIMM